MGRRQQSREVQPQAESWLVLPDMHVRASGKGGLDLRTWDAVLRYASDHEWAGVLQLGDLGDWNVISDHNKGKPRLIEGQRIEDEYKAIATKLGELRDAVGETPRLVILEGNHDYRVEKYIHAHPEMEGILEYPVMMKQVFIMLSAQWVPSWSRGQKFELGKLTLVHGDKTGPWHTAAMLRDYQCNIMYGHTHDVQCYSVTGRGDNKTHTAQSVGTLSVYDPEWLRGKPNKWQQAFAEVCVFPDGFFNYWVTQVFKHRFVSASGRVYQG